MAGVRPLVAGLTPPCPWRNTEGPIGIQLLAGGGSGGSGRSGGGSKSFPRCPGLCDTFEPDGRGTPFGVRLSLPFYQELALSLPWAVIRFCLPIEGLFLRSLVSLWGLRFSVATLGGHG